MDKISKLLEETRNLLQVFSSGTLSPVNSEENESDGNDEALINKFREIIRNNSGLIGELENYPKFALHICVEEVCKDIEVYKALLRAGCDPLEQNNEHKTPLTLLLDMTKVAEEDKCLISTLLGEWELRKAVTNESKIFKLVHAQNWKDLYSHLIQQNPDNPAKIISKPDPKYAGLSPLHEIAATNNVGILRKLLSKFDGEIDLNVKAIGSGNTPLHEASHMSAVEMVKLLLEHGARSDMKNAAGKIPAHLGTEKIQILIEFTKQVKTRQLSSKKTADLFVQATKSSSTESLSREERKLKQIIGFLDQIEKHKDAFSETEEPSESVDSSLNSDPSELVNHSASGSITGTKRPKMFDLETILQRENHTGRTLLHRFARRNQTEKLVKFLKSQELTSTQCKDLKLFEVFDNGGHVPLHDAASEGSLEVAKIFLFGGRTAKVKNLLVDPSIPAKLTGDTPLHFAAAGGNTEIVQLLLEIGAKPDTVNIEGKRPIDMATTDSIKALLRSDNTPVVPIAPVTAPVKQPRHSETTTQLHPVKRGPGRPRKHPRPTTPSNQTISKSSSIIRSPSKHHKSNTPPLPIKEILPAPFSCLLLLKFTAEWVMLKDHFSSIYQHLLSKHTHHTQQHIEPEWFRPLSPSERTEISRLPRLADLIETLQLYSLNSPSISLIPKALANQILEKEFNYSLAGPFAYIDLAKLGQQASINPYSGCPLKLKLKLEKEFHDQKLHNSILTVNLEIPKSPHSFHI